MYMESRFYQQNLFYYCIKIAIAKNVFNIQTYYYLILIILACVVLEIEKFIRKDR